MAKSILLVDDERSVREIVRDFLLLDQHTVVEANNGAEALALFRKGPFDVVIIDLKMPFMTGDELAVFIKRVAPHQPIIMLTGHAGMVTRFQGVNILLAKPVDLPKLQDAIAKLSPDTEPVPA
jgi:CheY-like chemotaxis protein